MNSNAIHNLMNIVGWIIGAIGAVLLFSGCSALPNGSFDCSASTVIPAWLLPYIMTLITVMLVVKTIINIGRDGLGGLWKPQPPVADDVKTVAIATPAGSGAKVEVTAATVKK